jgi:hypothetical protein
VIHCPEVFLMTDHVMCTHEERSKIASIRRCLMLSALALAQLVYAESVTYSPAAQDELPRQVFWGDTHLHTNISADSYNVGNPTHSPEHSYRLARGETIVAQNGMRIRLRRPLDFLVVSDHAEYLGISAGAFQKDEQVLSTELGQRLSQLMDAGDTVGATAAAMRDFFIATASPGEEVFRVDPAVRQSIWSLVGARADEFNLPGHFTAFVGYEYTPMPALANLHRVVIFRDGADYTSQVLPFSVIDSPDPEDLWDYMGRYEDATGGSVLAIPHNSNLSAGRMFDETTYTGKPITAAYAEKRRRWEPLVEVTQIKGDSETHPFLSPEDEFADYETWRFWSGGEKYSGPMNEQRWQTGAAGSYARSALRRGLEFDEQVGGNPYKFGMIGSTDSHTAMPTAEEDNFWGKMGTQNPSPTRWDMSWGMGDVVDEAQDAAGRLVSPINWVSTASGLAAVWAKDNTREDIFDAMRRKEVYATTGPRMTVRLFGGWDFVEGDDLRSNYVDIGYARGVPMGGDLTATPQGASPTFMVLAAKDPDGANIDRIQIIKGWVDAAGKSHEKVFNVAWSKDRTLSAQGQLEAVSSTVDVKSALYTNTVGAPLLSTVWTDPEFDKEQKAFYYARVLQIPTPRWPAYDAAFYDLDLPPDIPQITQERAYTSPIWYAP